MKLNIFLSILSISASLYAAGVYDGGDGSADNPYQINTPEHLMEIKYHWEDWDKHFIMTGDIDLCNAIDENNIKPLFGGIFNPYYKKECFTGIIDGKNHIIKGLEVFGGIGLFGYIGSSWEPGGLVKNITFSEVSVPSAHVLFDFTVLSGSNYGAIENCNIINSDLIFDSNLDFLIDYNGLVDKNYGTIENCNIINSDLIFDPNLNFLTDYNGLVDKNYGTIDNCHITEVSILSYNSIWTLNGLAYENSGIIRNCSVKASIAVMSDTDVVGLVYQNEKSGLIENCTTDISVYERADDVVGLVFDNLGNIFDCNAKSDLVISGGLNYVSGLVYDNGGQYVRSNARIENCSVELSLKLDEDKESPSISDIAGIAIFNSNNIIRNCSAILNIEIPFDRGIWGAGGGIASENKGNIIECNVVGGIAMPRLPIGGIVRDNDGKIVRCWTNLDTCIGGLSGTGGIAVANSGTIKNCYSEGDVEGYGGLAGGIAASNGGLIDSCYATGNIYCYKYNGDAGGIAGFTSGNITNCYSTGQVVSNGFAGGVIGELWYDKTLNCYSTGDVYALIGAGGFIGRSYIYGGSIVNCYTLGNVYSEDAAGGFVGVYSGGKISKCYASGAFLSDQCEKGGFVGRAEKVYGLVRQGIKKSFWDKDISSVENAFGEGEEVRGMEGLTTEELCSIEYLRNKGWSAGDQYSKSIWTMNDGVDYPQLTGFMPQTISIDSVNLKADNTRDEQIYDSVEITGRLNVAKFATAIDVRNAMQDITFGILHQDGESVYGYSQIVPADDIKVNNNGELIKYQSLAPGITNMNIDLDTATFTVNIAQVDLTGIKAPLEITLECGDFAVGTVVAETIEDYLASGADIPHIVDTINGKSNIPIKLIDGINDALRVEKCIFKTGKKSNKDYLLLLGEISLEDNTIDLSNTDITATFGTYSVTLPADNILRIGKRDAFKYKQPKEKDGSSAMAIFDLDKCKFQLLLKNADIGPQDNPALFSISFGGYSEGVEVSW